MGFHLWGEDTHEWFAIVFLFIVLQHNLLNLHWFNVLFQGPYDPFRAIKLLVNVLLLGLICAALISGLMLSQHVLANLAVHNGSDFVRKTHMISVHWLQISIAIHLGVHWKMLTKFFAQLWHIPVRSLATKILAILCLTLSIYGVSVFIERDMLSYLMLQVDYAFFDFEEPRLLFYFDYFSVTILFAYMTRFLLWLVLFRGK